MKSKGWKWLGTCAVARLLDYLRALSLAWQAFKALPGMSAEVDQAVSAAAPWFQVMIHMFLCLASAGANLSTL